MHTYKREFVWKNKQEEEEKEEDKEEEEDEEESTEKQDKCPWISGIRCFLAINMTKYPSDVETFGHNAK